MAMHRAPDNYVPLKTATIVLWFVGLLVAITYGLSVGNSMSVTPSPLFDPFPIAQEEDDEWSWFGGSTADIPIEESAPTSAPSAPETVLAVAAPAAPARTTSVAATSAPQPVRTPVVVETDDIPVTDNKTKPIKKPVVEEPLVEEPVVTVPAPIEDPVDDIPVVETPDPVIETPDHGVEDPGEKDTPESNCIQQGLEWDGLQCMQPQLPEEVIGRQVDGPNGEVCTVVDLEGTLSCIIPEIDELIAVP